MPNLGSRLPPLRRRLIQKIRNPERLKKWTQLASVFVALLSVLGLSASRIIHSPWALTIVGVIALGVAALPIFIQLHGVDIYTCKEDVDWLCDVSIRSAEHSLDIISGDMSWLRDERRGLPQVFAALIHRGCTVRIVCKPPENFLHRRENYAAALFAGAQVRALPADHRPTPFSALFVIDRDNHRELSVCRLQTTEPPGPLTDNFAGISKPAKKRYWAKRALPTRDIVEVESALALSKAYWACSSPILLHEPLPIDAIEIQALILAALQKVPLYSQFQQSDFSMKTLRVADLFSWCIREDKLLRTENIVTEMEKQGLTMFETSLVCSNFLSTVMLPPIVEVHGEKNIVFDGTHRLWHLYRRNPEARAIVLAVTASGPLPATPHRFSKLPFFSGRLTRSSDLHSYKPEHWRSFTPMEDFLALEGSKQLKERYLAYPSPRMGRA